MKTTPFSRLLIFISAVLAIGLLLFLAHESQAAGTTATIREIDDDGNVGLGTSVAINSLNQEVIAYHDFTNSSLKVAVCDTDPCYNPEIETVDNVGYVGEQPDLVINSQDRPVISHYDRDNGDLRLTVCNDSLCTGASTNIVDQAGNVGINSSIVLDDAGRPVISYFDSTNKDLKIAYCNNLACAAPTIKTVDPSGSSGLFSSLVLDENGLAVIAYYDAANTHLKIAFCNDAVCSVPLIRLLDNTGDAGQYPSLAIISGRIFVSYFRDDGAGEELKIAQCNDATCGSVTVVHVIEMQEALFSSMVMNEQGQAFISFLDKTNGDLVVAACIIDPIIGCNEATFTRVDHFFVTGLYTDITLNQEGTPVISYYDQEEEALNLAKCPLCRVPARNNIGATAGQDTISLVVNDIGNPIITYQDSGDNNFYIVFCQDTVCDTSEKTSLGTNLHLNPSMVLQENGRPAVAYFHASTNELKYTICNNDDCTDQTTNVIAFDGFDPTLKFNSDGLPVISYYNAGNNNLILARCNDTACSAPLLSIVDDSGDVGGYTSMVLTAEDYPVISYYDATNDTIKFAICDDEGCTNPDFGNAQVTDGPFNALAVSDDDSQLFIAFYNNGGQGLNVLKCGIPCNGTSIGAIDYSTNDVGWDISIVLGEEGFPVITYYDVENGVLRMATCLAVNCSSGTTLSVIDQVGFGIGRFSQIALNGRGWPVIASAEGFGTSARVLVYDTEPTYYQVYTPVVLSQ